jgi:hypothetical protein
MRKLILAVTFLSVAALAWAGDTPWKDKPYDQWDQKDVSKIISDSPWAKTLRVDATWKPAGGPTANGANGAKGVAAPTTPQGGTNPGGTAPAQPNGGGQMPAAGGSGRGYGGGNSGAAAAGGDEGDDQGGSASTIFEVRWASSRIMREAFVRAAELGNHLSPADAKKTLDSPITTYQIIVVGPDMTPFVGKDEASLKSDAILQLKKSKKKISPIAVTIQKDGDAVKDVIFEFTRKGDNGEPTIAPDEKGATFECKVDKLNLKASFDVSKMADNKGSDL